MATQGNIARGSLWPVATLHGMMNNMMIGLMLLVVACFGFILPKYTGYWASLAVPGLAILGIVYLFRLPKPQLSIESDHLVYRKGRKVRRFNLATLKFGYARWQVQVGGVVGSVLVAIRPQASTRLPAEASAAPRPPAPLVFDLPLYNTPLQSSAVFWVMGSVGAATLLPSVFIVAGPVAGGGAVGGVLLLVILILTLRKKRKAPQRLRVSVEQETVFLGQGDETLSSVPLSEIGWSAGTYRISNGRSGSWLMPIMILQFPNYEPVTIGTMSQEKWTFAVKDVGRPQFQLGVALWLQLARALGMDRHLK